MIYIHKIWRIPRYWLGFRFQIALKKRSGHKVVGVTNKIGSRYVLFLDYDITRLVFVVKEVFDLQQRHSLGNAYVFKSGRGFHVIIPDLLNYKELRYLLEETSIEEAYINVPRRNNKIWVLRITPKGANKTEYIGVMKARGHRKKSAPHLHYLKSRGVPKTIITHELTEADYNGEKVEYARYEA